MNSAIMDWSAWLDSLADALADAGGEGWMVGGCLRDALLGVPAADVDVSLSVAPLPVAERIARHVPFTVARMGRGTVRLATRHLPGRHLDLTQLQGDTIAGDLSRRDFTVNAMALPLDARAQWLARKSSKVGSMPDLIDPYGGREHLALRRLVAVGPDTFYHDSGRIIRAARLRAQYGLAPDSETTLLAREAVPTLVALSADRVRGELDLLLALPSATDGIELLNDLGALSVLFSRVSGAAIPLALAALRQLDVMLDFTGAGTNCPAIRAWGAIDARRVALRRATLSRAGDSHESDALTPTLWRQAGAVLTTDDDRERMHAARLLFAQAGHDEPLALDALLVTLAYLRSDGDQERDKLLMARAEALVETYVRHRDSLIPAPLLSGGELIAELSLTAGPEVGRLLQAVRLAQLRDDVTDHDEALALARRIHAL